MKEQGISHFCTGKTAPDGAVLKHNHIGAKVTLGL